MAFLMSQVSVVFMLCVMSYLAVSCAADQDNKTAKQTSSIVVCCSVVVKMSFPEQSNELACNNELRTLKASILIKAEYNQRLLFLVDKLCGLTLIFALQGA